MRKKYPYGTDITKLNLPYEVKYIVLPSRSIYNGVGPDNNLSRWIPRNPYVKVTEERLAMIPHYVKLEEDVLKNGFRNPIQVIAGDYPEAKLKYLPLAWENDPRKVLICIKVGGSRLWVAQKHNFDIPCLVLDYANVFPDAENILDILDIYKYFMDEPREVIVRPEGIKICNTPQVHMGESGTRWKEERKKWKEISRLRALKAAKTQNSS